MIILGKCFRKSYLSDLIVRHVTATKSQTARREGKPLDAKNQLETIHLTRLPLRDDGGKRYKTSPLSSGKTVLVLDDICTEGYSLDAARNFIQQTGAKAILVSWLKTPNRAYSRIDIAQRFDPFGPRTFAALPAAKRYLFSDHVADRKAPQVIGACLEAYKSWDWPSEKRVPRDGSGVRRDDH
jgi:hypothetical protein